MSIITLITSDSQEFEVEQDVISMSNTIKLMIEDLDGDDSVTPLPNVTGKILDKVIVYCEQHYQDPEPKEENRRTDDISPWDSDFMKMDQATLFEIILAANYLDIKPLLDLACKTVANMIKGKTPDEIRKTFNIKNDFTPEQEAQIRKENEWCEER